MDFSLLEYDLEIKLTKLVKGQGLVQLMTWVNLDVLGINFLSTFSRQMDDPTSDLQVLPNFSSSPWYKDIIYVLKHLQAPINMDKNRTRFVKLKVVKYCILNGCLYWKDPRGILLNCLLEDEAKQMSKEFH